MPIRSIMKSMVRISLLLFCALGLASCVIVNQGGSVGEISIPSLELNCPGTEAADCLGNPGFSAGAAANKSVGVVWMNGKCSEFGTILVLQGESTGTTLDAAGTQVQYLSSFVYSNSETKLERGTYALWTYIDTNNDNTLDIGEPVVCTDVSAQSEIGAIAIISGWRDATTTDQTTLQ